MLTEKDTIVVMSLSKFDQITARVKQMTMQTLCKTHTGYFLVSGAESFLYIYTSALWMGKTFKSLTRISMAPAGLIMPNQLQAISIK